MSRVAPKITCSPEVRVELERRAASRTEAVRTVDRARMMLGCLNGQPVLVVAKDCRTRENTVIKWRDRFVAHGLPGLEDLPRPGARKVYDDEFRRRVLATLEQPPPIGQAVWDGSAVARVVISIDEKPRIQALERTTGYVETDNGKIVRGFKSTYERHGTLNLFAALRVATGQITSQITTTKRREDFLGFMDAIIAETPADNELHVILDNYCTHKRCDAWLAQHPNVHFHFTPTSASWLNQVEIWFGILSRKALRGASFKSIEDLRQAIEDFVAAYNPSASPFRWRKREVHGSQLRNTIVNLRKSTLAGC